MKVRFWGVRGSIPSPIPPDELESKIARALLALSENPPKDEAEARMMVRALPPLLRGTVGGDTPCVEVDVSSGRLVIDAGSGLRSLGVRLMETGEGLGKLDLHVLMGHTHWDHVQGFPFFRPAYVRGNRITIYSPFPDIEERFDIQQHSYHFPVPLDAMSADIRFEVIEVGRPFEIGSAKILPFELAHPGRSFGYRIEEDGRSVVYASDSEFTNISSRHIEYGRNVYTAADALIFDSQFTFLESLDRFDWGHCSSYIGVDLSVRESVKRIFLFHFDPSYSDEVIGQMLEDTRRYLKKIAPDSPLEVLVAQEGEEYEL